MTVAKKITERTQRDLPDQVLHGKDPKADEITLAYRYHNERRCMFVISL